MILTVAQTYPSVNNMYNNGFVHARVKSYIENNIDAKVFVINNSLLTRDYCIENVEVVCGDVNKLVDFVNSNSNITCVCFHFLNISMIRALEQFNSNINVVIFVHGNEALHWYERIFPDRFSTVIRCLKFVKYVIVNTFSLLYIKNKINNFRNINIVCVSNWMRNITIKNWGVDVNKIPIHIIPNIVNEKTFPYVEKKPDKRYNILMIRQFTSGKYALDVAMDTIKLLQEYPESANMNITVVGDGWLHEKYTSRIRKYKNVKLLKKFLSHKEISNIHAQNGIFLCPTRMDAQGVSMCEAMSSGLVPISSDNTAIPEFLPNEYNLACTDSRQAAQRIIEIIRNEEQFLMLSQYVSKFIQEKCSSDETVLKEIRLMKSLDKV